jgi:hypothetical protein
MLAGFTAALGAPSASAVFGMVVGTVTKMLQIVELGIDRDDDVSAIAAVSAIGSALGDKFFPAKTGTAVATAASFGPYSDSIHKHSSTG